jgi:phosphotransferase system enzyme I (PtsP)
MSPTIATSASRHLLASVRDVMAGSGVAQERLNHIVTLIAMSMDAEVCSCYIMRAGEVLELFATQGLLQTAVHTTRLRVGEGLVGDIAARARPLALSDAQNHPNFAYRPETGEDIYQSLVGVPIIRSARVVGVLVVQNKSQRQYTDEEIETLETVAMVLAELVISGSLINIAELASVDGNAILSLRLEGIRLTRGIGIGVAHIYNPQIEIDKMVSDDPEHESVRLRIALGKMQASLEEMFDNHALSLGREYKEFLEIYQMFAEDSGWINRMLEAIRYGLTAEAAVQSVHEESRLRMSKVNDPYLRERLNDLEDIANRLLRYLVAEASPNLLKNTELPEDTILFCRSLGPTELLDLDRKKIRAIAMEEGSPTMHVTILARALDIPMIGRLGSFAGKIDSGDLVIVDGELGQVYIRPTDDILELYNKRISDQAQKSAAFAAMKDLPAVTKTGEKVHLMMNAGFYIDLPQLEETGADGIGLFRTEMAFMTVSQMPNVEEQKKLYSEILNRAQDRPVIFRTLDIGSDKLLPYWHSPKEDNPAMGWRSIRISLDRPAVLRQQLRALVQAGSDRHLKIMFPMVAEVDEFDRLKDILDLELARHQSQGAIMPQKVSVGTMLEIPALAWQLPILLDRIDFLSVGSNDLMQFLFAIDRGNQRVSDRYDSVSPSMLNFLKMIVKECKIKSVPLSVCGEMAGRPLEAMALLGIGVRSLSMAASSIGPVKAMIRSLSLPILEDYIETLCHNSHHSLRVYLNHFARDHHVII